MQKEEEKRPEEEQFFNLKASGTQIPFSYTYSSHRSDKINLFHSCVLNKQLELG